ncbi:DUF4349 domain-containing protein [Clostridium bowmanii]|uniref:DUF4349 domain-containing protein n=1 Tax=Clostridium bowmanii TaxID=132925 RepID=UPI001C0C0F64|nr:DUF4349 domain-containing protein [Clostridium bowmanii]MBU3192084.1 DUF4349 domain-containing protein [Clostridium bowmanii]MCA1076335.1 DUF4349 domain-containing protein [Clostridium bowmanii]
MKRKFKSIAAILMLIIIIIGVTVAGCGAKKSTSSPESKASMDVSKGDSGFGNSGAATSNETAKTKTDSKNNINASLQGQGKIIRNGIIQMETLNFDVAVKKILNKTSSMGAYVQSSNVSGTSIEAKLSEQSRRGTFILRIPKTKFDSFILDIGSLGSITSKQISTEDVTSAYFDTQAHLKSLTIQEERLIELLKKTGELKDIIVLEKELTSVRYEIESLTGNLKKWDNLIDFCTLNIEIAEVHKIKENPVSFIDKIANGFVSSVKSLVDFSKEFVVVLSILIPYLVVLSIILLIGIYIYKHRKKS